MNRTIIFYIMACMTGFCNNVFSAGLEVRADRAKIDELWDTLGDETPAGRARADRLFRSGEVGRTPLHIACANRDYKEVKRLIGAGASVHAQEYGTNKTPLCSLVDDLQPEQDLEVVVDIINLLASKGAKADAAYNLICHDMSILPRTPLNTASYFGLPNVVAALLQAGATVNNRTTLAGITGMHATQSVSMVSHLRRHQIARKIYDEQKLMLEKITPDLYKQAVIAANIASHENIYAGYWADDTAQILLDYGADPSLTDDNGLIPLYAAEIGARVLQSSLFDRTSDFLDEHGNIDHFEKATLDDEKTSIGQLRTKLKKFNSYFDEQAAEAEYMPR